MHRRPVLWLALALAATATAGCTGGPDPAPAAAAPTSVAPPPVELETGRGESALQGEVRVGVLVSLSSPAGQGSDLLPLAAGARVAQYRLDLGRADVVLDVVDDGGQSDGAREAVRELAGQGVIGVVAATQGDHLDAALDQASQDGLPVLLPYDDRSDLPDGTWTTGPSGAAVDAAVRDALGMASATSPYVLTADGVTVDAGRGATTQPLATGQVTPAVDAARRAVRQGEADAVVVAGSPQTLGQVVGELQGSGLDAPLVLSPEAMTPAFVDSLGAAGGTSSGRFTTVGVDAGDTTTLGTGDRAESVAAYFAALRLAAADPDVQDLFDSTPFAEVAGAADPASHDAVVALVRAAEAAGSTDPAAVRDALAGLSLDGGDGLAGAPLDFSSPAALSPRTVVPLAATTQDPGVRPADDVTRLYWFPVPDQG